MPGASGAATAWRGPAPPAPAGGVREEGHELRVVLAGGGPLLAEMRRYARAVGLDDCVALPGPLGTDEVRTLLDEAAIACLVSSSEGMPGSLMEAMATRVAVVGT